MPLVPSVRCHSWRRLTENMLQTYFKTDAERLYLRSSLYRNIVTFSIILNQQAYRQLLQPQIWV